MGSGSVRKGLQIRGHVDKVARYVKYGIIAPVLSAILRRTPWLDGRGAPPDLVNFSGQGDFVALGDVLVASIENSVGLTDEMRILDVGCGIGRVATGIYRRRPGIAYLGFDVVEYGILWCRKAIRAPNFQFDHHDIYNSFYNPRGRIRPETFRFPYADNSFDLILIISVYTHMLESPVRQYFGETIRCLDHGGRIYLTTFLPERRALQGASFSFAHRHGAAALERLEEPELAVGYSLEFWRDLVAEHGAEIQTSIPGSWAGTEGADFQDILVIRKIA